MVAKCGTQVISHIHTHTHTHTHTHAHNLHTHAKHTHTLSLSLSVCLSVFYLSSLRPLFRYCLQSVLQNHMRIISAVIITSARAGEKCNARCACKSLAMYPRNGHVKHTINTPHKETHRSKLEQHRCKRQEFDADNCSGHGHPHSRLHTHRRSFSPSKFH